MGTILYVTHNNYHSFSFVRPGSESVFPQLWNKFCEISQFPEIEEGHSARVSMPAKNVHNLHNIDALFKRIVHSFWVGPLTKQIEISVYAIKLLKNKSFSNHKSHIFLHVYIYFSYSWIFWKFLELFNILKITLKWSGFPRIQEISFKVETLLRITN